MTDDPFKVFGLKRGPLGALVGDDPPPKPQGLAQVTAALFETAFKRIKKLEARLAELERKK
jgi:hypothetical protein